MVILGILAGKVGVAVEKVLVLIQISEQMEMDLPLVVVDLLDRGAVVFIKIKL